MGLTRSQKKAYRQHKILQALKEGGQTGNALAEKFGVSRGIILKDIAELRRSGYPIQVSSMTTENGMYVAVYELPKYVPKP